MAEKEIVIEYGGRSYGKAAIQDLLQRVDAMRTSGEEMGKEIASLKRQIGGLKTSNVNYKKQVEKLKAEVEHYKALDKEGDELYEGKIAEIEEIKKRHYGELKEKQRVTDGLSAQVHELIEKNRELETKVSVNNEYIVELEATIEELEKPWWKKLF
jgi:chromosome segregation ATPase